MKIFKLLFLILTLTSCKENNKSNTLEKVKATETGTTDLPNNELITKSENGRDGTFLCTINGNDWAYTKASGIVDTHAKTKKRTAIITFTKQLEKGKETVQLFYDAQSKTLEQVSIHLKVTKNDGKTMTAMYIYHPDTNHFHPNAKISGTVDLSNPTSASGKAEISELDARFDKNDITNAQDKLITVENLNFKGVGYSDLDKVFSSK